MQTTGVCHGCPSLANAWATSRLEGGRPAPFAALRVSRCSERSQSTITCAEAPSRSPPDRRASSSPPKPVAASAAPPASVPKRRGAQPMMKERAELQARELAKVAQRAQRGRLGQQVHTQQQPQHVRSPARQEPPSPFHAASQQLLQYQQQAPQPVAQQQRQSPQLRAGLGRQQRLDPQHQQQQQLRERQQSSAEASTSASTPQRSRLLQRRAPPRAVSVAPPRVPPPPRPALQAAVKSNKPRDWQVTRDWLVMELDDIRLDDETFRDLTRSCNLEQHWRPQIALYHQLGMSKGDLCKLADARRQLFDLSVPTVRSKLAFLRHELAMDDADIRKVLLKFPRIIEYKTERTVRPRLDFLLKHGVLQSDLSKVVLRAPQTMELHVEDTLEPRVAFLRDSVGVAPENMGKVITRLPSVLTYTEDFMQQRVDFLRGAGLSDEELTKAVTSHPQVLHYRVECMEEKLRYLRSIGMRPDQVAVVLQRLPQLLSLDIRNNLVPKYNYLQAELGGSVQTVASYPAYFSLSLPLRIMPRHRYLQLVRSQKVWPFPMNYLKCSDLLFAANVANTPLDKFEAFKEEFVAGHARNQLLAERR